MVKHEWSADELKHKAEAYCATAERCASEVTIKLQQWDASEQQIEDIVAHLKAQRYIDEERYCRAFAHDKVLYQGWGRIKIRAALFAKRLAQQDINNGIDSIDEIEYFDTLRRVIATKKRAIKSNDPMAREKLIRFCLQRGFTYDEIEQLV
jgi:regulatory protein